MPNCKSCKSRARYNYKNEKERMYCKYHKEPDMIDFDEKHKYCIEENCIKRSSYNYEDIKKAIYCEKHKKENMINTTSHKCQEPNCIKAASCNLPNETKRLYCVPHAKDGMVNLTSKICVGETDGIKCIRVAYYNLPNEKVRLYCREHCDVNTMIDLTHKKVVCIEPNCTKQSSYNFENCSEPKYCVKHATDEMIDVRTKTCLDCNTKPTFNYRNSIGAIYCVTHAKKDMINIYKVECLYEGCTTTASYNYKGLKKRLYCAQHFLPDMINISSKRCENEGCETICKYNFENEKIPRFCAKHAEKDMIHLSRSTCKEEGCKKYPSFNFENNGSGMYCMKHMKVGMINVNDPICKDCNTQASFNYPGETIAHYCASHYKENMINIYSLRCKSLECDIIIRYNGKYNDYCITCYKQLFPNDKIVYNYGAKETVVRVSIKNKFIDKDWQFNKMIKKNGIAYVPDILLSFENYNIIIEIDEFQHSNYNEENEERRTFNLYKFLSKKLIIIRFNPDGYTDIENNYNKSPWVFDNTALIISEDTEIQNDWNNRLNILHNNIQECIDKEPLDEINVIKLFYNEV